MIKCKCAKCHQEIPQDDLIELFTMGLYVCESCVNEWLKEKEMDEE